MAGVHFRVTGDANGYIAATRQAEAATGKMVGSITSEARKIDSIFKTLATSAGAVFTLQMASQFAKQVAQIRGQFQQLEVAFETMLQSKEKADALMAQIVDTAARTPFDLQGVANGAKQLLAYGVASEEVNDTLIRLGDIAAGLSIPLNDLVYLYGTTMAQGRMFTQDLRQFQGRGIPMAEELAKVMGVTKSEVAGLVTAGKVGFPEMQKTIMNMTSEGGKFANLMQKQSQTITGQISNLQDAVDQMFNEIGKASDGAISSAIGMASSLVENYEQVGRIIGGLVTAYGTYRAALMAINAYHKAHLAILTAEAVAKRLNAAATNKVTAATVLLAKAQKTLNASMLANPYVLAAAAVAALGVGIYALVTAKSKEEKAHERVNGQIERYNDNLEKQRQQMQELFDTINTPESTDMQRVVAMEQLRELYPTILKDLSDEELMKLSVADATRKLNEENERLLRSDLQSQLVKASAGYDAAMQKVNSYKSSPSNMYQKDSGYQQAKKDAENYRIELEALITALNKIDDTAKKADFLALPADQKIISLKESNSQLDTEIAELDKKLQELRSKKESIAGEQPQNFSLGSLPGAMYGGGMTEEQLLAEIKKRQEQKKANDNDIAANQAKVDEQNKVLTDKQRKADYDRQRAKQKAAEELEKMTRDLNNKIAQADIDSMEEGYDKTIRQLTHNLELENQAIEQQKKDLLKRKENDALQSWLAQDPENRKAYDFKYTATLTPEELKLFEDMGRLAQQQFDKGREDAGEKWEKEAGFFTRQLEINAMAAGSDKDNAQRQLDNERELHSLEMQRDAYIEAAKAAHLFAVEKGKASGAFDETKANQEFNKILEDFRKAQTQASTDAFMDDMNVYLMRYGDYEGKKLAITQEYSKKIKEANNIWQKNLFTREMEQELEKLKREYDEVYSKIFRDPGKMTKNAIAEALKLAREQLKQLDRDAQPESYEAIVNAIDRLETAYAAYDFEGWEIGLNAIVKKYAEILIIQEKINDAKKKGDAKAEQDASEELKRSKEDLRKSLIATGADKFGNALTNAAGAMKEIAEISGDVRLENLAEGLESVGNILSSTASGAASGGALGAFVGFLTSTVGNVTNAIKESAIHQAKLTKQTEEWRHQLELSKYVIDETDFSSIWGDNVFGKVNDAISKLNDARIAADDASLALRDYIRGRAERGHSTADLDPYWAKMMPNFYTGGERGTRPVFDVEKAKAYLATVTEIDEDFKKLIQDAIDFYTACDEADKILNETLKSFVGDTADSLTDVIFDAIDNGADAWNAFEEKGSEAIRSIGKQMLKDIIAQDLTENWSERLKAATGDPDKLAEEYAAMMEWIKEQSEAYSAIATDWEEKHGGQVSTRESSAKGAAQASQDSVDELNGRATAIQSHTFSINERVGDIANMTSQILAGVISISTDTARLSKIESSLTSMAGDISDIWTKVRGSL